MAIEIKYLKDGQGLLYRATGSIVHGEELIASVKDVYASPERVATLRFAIVDYSLVQQVTLSQADIQEIAALNLDAGRINTSAVIATVTHVRLMTTLVYEWETLIKDTGWELKTFFSYPEALEWVQERVSHKYFIQVQERDLPQYTHVAPPESDTDIDTSLVTKWQHIVDLLCDIAQVPVGLIMRVYDERIHVFVSSHTEDNPYSPGDGEQLIGSGLYCEHVVETQAKLKVVNALQFEEWADSPALRYGLISYLGYPIRWPSGEMFGTICILDVKKNSHNAMIERLMTAFRDIIETHLVLLTGHQEISKHLLELSKLHVELEKQAQTDDLTGLLNRKTFQTFVDIELARRTRSGAELCFCLCDIDHFKKVNDSYGHPVGDIVLNAIAGRLKNTLRSYDVIWRWGGEEFLIMCPDSTLEVGAGVAERLRATIEQPPVQIDELILNVTMSFGITTIQQGEDIGSCLKRCDRLLYLAKEHGRNRVMSDRTKSHA